MLRTEVRLCLPREAFSREALARSLPEEVREHLPPEGFFSRVCGRYVKGASLHTVVTSFVRLSSVVCVRVRVFVVDLRYMTASENASEAGYRVPAEYFGRWAWLVFPSEEEATKFHVQRVLRKLRRFGQRAGVAEPPLEVGESLALTWGYRTPPCPERVAGAPLVGLPAGKGFWYVGTPLGWVTVDRNGSFQESLVRQGLLPWTQEALAEVALWLLSI